MPTVPTPNTACVHVRGTNDGQQTENTFFYELAGAVTQAALDALVVAISNAVVSEWIPLMPPGWSGRQIYAEDLTSGSGLQAFDNTIFGMPGEFDSDTLPNNDTLSIARKSALAGRSFRGRIYWQAMSSGYLVSQNRVASSAAISILNAIAALDEAAVLLDWTPVIVSLFSLGAPRAAGVTTPITAWQVVDTILDSRRRRLPGRGV